MKQFLKLVIFWVIVAAIFFCLFSVEKAEGDSYSKLRVVARWGDRGVVVRMKPDGWELWKLESKVESSEIFSNEMDFVNQYLVPKKKQS